jgi:hypothetical protein
MSVLKIGPNSVVAKKVVNLSTLFNSGNCAIIFEVDGQYKSWQPGGELNSITSTVISRGYTIIATAEIDVSDYFGDFADGYAEALIDNPIPSNFISYVNKTASAAFTLSHKNSNGDVLGTFPLPVNGAVYLFLNTGDNLTLASNAVLAAQVHLITSIINNAGALTYADQAAVGTIGQTYTLTPDMDLNKIYNAILK